MARQTVVAEVTERDAYYIPTKAVVTKRGQTTTWTIQPMGHMFYAVLVENPDGSTIYEQWYGSPRQVEEWLTEWMEREAQ